MAKDKLITFRCNEEVAIAFKKKYGNISETLRDFMEQSINESSDLEDKEEELKELENQSDILLTQIKILKREIKKEKELENNSEILKQRLNKAIEVCFNKYKASNEIGVTIEDIIGIAKAQKINKHVLINAIGELEDKKEIKIVSKFDKELKMNESKPKFKPKELTPIERIFIKLDKHYMQSVNRIHDPKKFLDNNQDLVNAFVNHYNEKEPNSEITSEDIETYFLENHSERGSTKN